MEGRGRGLKVPSYLRFDGQVGFSPLKNWGKERKSSQQVRNLNIDLTTVGQIIGQVLIAKEERVRI